MQLLNCKYFRWMTYLRKPIWEVQREQIVIKLASNENSLGPSPKALEQSKEPIQTHYHVMVLMS